MSNRIFILCLKNAFEKNPLLLIKDKEEIFTRKSVNYLNHKKGIISYDFDVCLNSIREKPKFKMPYVIDILIAKKLLVGQPKSKFKQNSRPWIIKNLLAPFKIDKSSLKWLIDFMQVKTKNLLLQKY